MNADVNGKQVGRLPGLTFITTDDCTARCAHCLMECSPGEPARLSAAQILRAVEGASELATPSMVVFSGGEPTLLGEDLLDAIASLSNLGIPTRMVTNSVWAETRGGADEMVRNLREAGLVELNLSVDDFHAVWIPFDSVHNAWRAAHGVGFASVVLALAEGERSKMTAEWLQQRVGATIPIVDSAHAGLPLPSADGTRYLINRAKLSRLGRGRGLRDSYLPRQGVVRFPVGPCDIAQAGSVVTASNRVAICCGSRPDGNTVLTGESLDQLTWQEASSKLENDVLVRALVALGPSYLWELAEMKGCNSLRRREAYANLCELCEDLTTSTEALAILRESEREISEALGCVEIAMSITRPTSHDFVA